MYKLEGHCTFQGLPIAIENGAGSERCWTDESTGEAGSTVMKYPYGYVDGTLGTDGDAVDVYVGPDKGSQKVFVVTQNQKPATGMAGTHPWVETDEQKVMLGFNSATEAQDAYLAHYDDSRFFGRMIELTMDAFKDRLSTQRGQLIKGKMADGGFTSSEASRIAKLMDLDLAAEGISLQQWIAGLNEELEHKDVTQSAAVKTGKIALAHLKEDSQYYAKLKKMEKGLNAEPQSAILTEDNIRMLVLSKSASEKAFKPQVLKPGSEEKNMSVTKAKLVDTEPDEEEETMKSHRAVAIAVLQKARTATPSSVVAVDVAELEPTQFSKALRAITVAGLTRRERMDAAYQLGVAQGHAVPRVQVETVQLNNLNLGTHITRPTHEPPVVPVRRVDPPQPAARPGPTMESCAVHGYIHKSGSDCSLCVQSRVSAPLPIWRR